MEGIGESTETKTEKGIHSIFHRTGITKYVDFLTLFRGDSGQTGSSAAKAILLIAMTNRMHISK